MGATSARRRSLLARRGRSVAGWTFASFLALQGALGYVMDRCEPAMRDPEYGSKLALLQARLAESPERPLTLILGSSRSGVGLLPGSFSSDRGPLFFNFAMTGAGPVRELMTLRRLLAAGIRPNRTLIEVHPLLFHGKPGIGELAGLQARQLDWQDLQLASRYVAEPGRLWQDWFRTRLTLCFSQRFFLMHRFAPSWLAAGNPLQNWEHLDAWGGLAMELSDTCEQAFQRRLAVSVEEYAPAFDGFRITNAPDRALRELLDTCRAEGIEAALFLMPEESRFAAAYPAGARPEIEAYLASLQREFGCPVFDATQWCEAADFCDGHHLIAGGAKDFSRRFAAQVLRPLIGWDEADPQDVNARESVAERPRRDRVEQPRLLR